MKEVMNQDQEIQWTLEKLNLKSLFVQVDYEDGIVITEEADHSRGGHSLLYWCIQVRSRPTFPGAIYLAENIIRYGIFHNKGKCLYFNTTYQEL